MIEWFGTSMSVLVAVSLTMKNIKKLRILNGLGALGFAVYGFLIASWPVFGLNAFITVIDIWFLWGMMPANERFKLLEVNPFLSKYVRYYIDFHKEEIAKYMPDFNIASITEDMKGFFILRDARPVSLILIKELDKSTREVVLDFAIPGFRDAKSGQYFFNKILLLPGGKSELVFTTSQMSAQHKAYLKKLGFLKEDSQYIKRISS